MRRAAGAAGLALGTAVIVVAVAAALTPVDPDPTADGHGWRGSYFEDLLFLGDPVIRPVPEVRFDWGRGSPFRSGPRDRFSVRWDTCLDLPAPGTIEAGVRSDDGSRAYVDGHLVVDNWGDHGMKLASAARPLSRGPHHVEIEYYDMSRDARVEATLTLVGETRAPIARAWLRIPTRPRAAPDVCAK